MQYQSNILFRISLQYSITFLVETNARFPPRDSVILFAQGRDDKVIRPGFPTQAVWSCGSKIQKCLIRQGYQNGYQKFENVCWCISISLSCMKSCRMKVHQELPLNAMHIIPFCHVFSEWTSDRSPKWCRDICVLHDNNYTAVFLIRVVARSSSKKPIVS